MTTELWKDVAGCVGFYQVSSLGRVRSIDRVIVRRNGSKQTIKGRVLRPGKIKAGYLVVSLPIAGKPRMAYVHRLLMEAFYPSLDERNEINHKNGDPSDNRPDNLEWVTHQENMIHSIKTGLRKVFVTLHRTTKKRFVKRNPYARAV